MNTQQKYEESVYYLEGEKKTEENEEKNSG